MSSNTNLVNAIYYASIKHSNQRRKNVEQTPYINHPIEVMQLVSSSGINDDNVLAAAVLHDVVEDSDATIEDILQLFGHKVAQYVAECTDDRSLSKLERKKEQIVHASKISQYGKLIKLADKISNLSDLLTNPPVTWSPEYIRGYFVWSFHVVKNLMGHNENLDKMIDDIFVKAEISNLTNQELETELEKYYSLI